MVTEMSDRLKAKMGDAKAWLKEAFGETDERLVEILHERRDTILSAMREQSENQSRFSPGEDEWSTIEVGRHLTHTHTGVSVLMQMLASGKTMEGSPTPGVVPEGPGDFGATCDELERSFGRLEKAFEKTCREGANLEITHDHPWFGAMNAREWFAFCSLHTSAHIDQVARIAGTEGFPEN